MIELMAFILLSLNFLANIVGVELAERDENLGAYFNEKVSRKVTQLLVAIFMWICAAILYFN